MDPLSSQFDALCREAAAGSPAAAARFRRHVLPYLRVIVRRALRSGEKGSAILAAARAAARRIPAHDSPSSPQGPESAASEVAREVCELLIRRIRSRGSVGRPDTVVEQIDLPTLLGGLHSSGSPT